MLKILPIPSENLNDLHDIMTFMTHLFFCPEKCGYSKLFRIFATEIEIIT